MKPNGKVESLKHQDKRKNIPTNELRDFMAEEEKAPARMLYPRDPSLDPQLVWQGKDEQDRQDLAVPVVPVYIQEKIHPQALVENLRCQAKAQAPGQMDFFADFNGISFEEQIEFYQHEAKWANRMILGDSLLVMTSLAEKEGLKGQVQMIYLDPPYGIKFGSNWQVSTRSREVKESANDITRQPEQVLAFRDTWKLGIHSYLAYLRDRLVISRELLSNSGSVFLQIGDDNVHLVRCILDEVFGSDNQLGSIVFSKTSSSTRDFLPNTFDHILIYAKEIQQVKHRNLFWEKGTSGQGGTAYFRIEEADGIRRTMTADEREGSKALPDGSKIYSLDNLTSQSIGREKGEGAACWFPVDIAGKKYEPSIKARWKTNELGMGRLSNAGRLDLIGNTVRYVRYLRDFPVFPISNLWADTIVAGYASDKPILFMPTCHKGVAGESISC